MKLIEAADATSIITTVIGYFTQNWPALAILIGFGVGLKLFRSFGNRGLKGRFQQFAGYTTPTTRVPRTLLIKHMKTIEIVQLITQTLSANFSSLLAIVAVGAGVKIVLDIIFKSLYSVTNSRQEFLMSSMELQTILDRFLVKFFVILFSAFICWYLIRRISYSGGDK